MFPGFDLYYADPAQSFITARQKLDGLDDELPEVWYIVPRTQYQVSSGADELSCIYLMNEAIRSELLHKPCRLRSARDATTSVAAPTPAAAVAAAAAAAAVDIFYCASIA